MTYKEPTLINGQPLSFYLTHPGGLKQVDKGVLQTLVVKYPYSAHLHLLLAIKDHLDNGIVSQELLEKAALYIPDRKKLGEWMNKLQNLRRSDAYGQEHLEALSEQPVPEEIELQEDHQPIDPETVATEQYDDDEFPTPEVLAKIEEPVQTAETIWSETDVEDEETIDDQLAPDEELADISDDFSTEDARADLQEQIDEEIGVPEDSMEDTVVEIDVAGEEESDKEIITEEPAFESLAESNAEAVETYEETIAEDLPDSDWIEEEAEKEEEEEEEIEENRENFWEEVAEVAEEEIEEEDEGRESWEDEMEEEEDAVEEESWQQEPEVEPLEPIEDYAAIDEEEDSQVPTVSAFDRVTDEESTPVREVPPSTTHVYLDQEAEDLPTTPTAPQEASETHVTADTELKLDAETIEDLTDHDSPFLNWLHRLSGTETGGFEELSEVSEEEESTTAPSPIEKEKKLKKEKKKKKKDKKKKTKKKKKKKKKRWEEESLRTDEALVSEALAEILANQGHYDRAIEMYKKLRLIIPEKSVFFAQKIEELESKK